MNNEVKTSKDFRDDILREQIRLVMEQVPTMQVGSFIVALVLSYVVRDIVPRASILLWVLMVLLIVCSRFVLYYRFRKIREEPFGGEYWKNLYLILALISGIVWGSSAFIIFPAGDLSLATFFLFVVASLSAATTVTHSSIRLGPAASAGPVLLPYAIRCLTAGEEFGYTWSFLIILYIFAIIRFSFIHNRSIASAIALKFENLELLAEVQRVNDILRKDITKRMQAEEALKSSLSLSAATLESTADGILVVDTAGKVTSFNRSFLELWRIPETLIETRDEKQLLQFVLDQLLNPDAFLDKVRALYQTADASSMDELVFKDGRIFERYSQPQRIDDTIVGRVWSFRDITERKRVEESLKLSNARISHLNDVLRAIRDVGSLINREKDPIELLNAVCDSLVQTRGYVLVWIGKPEPDSKRVLMVAHSGGGADFPQHAPITWDDSPTGQGPTGTAIRERRAVVFDDLATDPRFALWKDPVMAYGGASIASVPLIHEERLFGVLTVKADRPHAFDPEEVELLSNLAADLARTLQSQENEVAHKRAEEALCVSETKLQAIFNTVGTGIFIIDRDTQEIIEANQTAAEMTGLPKERIIGQICHLLVCPAEVGKCPVKDLGQKVDNSERKLLHADGQSKDILKTVYPVTINGRDCYVESFIDITDRKRGEKERKKLEEQLFQAQKMESVGRLAGGVAHDFNNMLGVIIGRAELALNTDVSADALQHNLKEILKAGLHSADLTRQLLGFARKQTAVPKILDLNVTISGMLEMLRRLVGEDIDLLWAPELDLWKVKIDPSQVDQILANLVVNARDAIPGVGSITMRTENVVIDDSNRTDTPEFIPGQYVLLTVSDTGAGMSQEVRENIFEPFFTTKEVGKGTGLGLSTVYGIVKQNDGFIYVASELGKGTTFNIYLPQFEAAIAQVPSEEITGKRPTGSETILLVEDDEAILNLGKIILENLGYMVIAAPTPRNAIHLAEEHPGDLHLLITDVVMPEMNGRELAKQLGAIRPNLKRLYMSGYTADVIAHRGILDEGVNFIQKPFGSSDLAAKVRQVLDHLG